MRKSLVLFILLTALPMVALAENWKDVSIIDTQCSTKAKSNPDSHTRSCALACAKSGFGIIDEQGHYLKFDKKGNQTAMKLLESSSKKDHLRVDVSGEKEGDVIHVDSLKLL